MYRGFGNSMNIIEQALPKPIFDEIKARIFAKEFPWYFVASTAYGHDSSNLLDSYSFYHTVINAGKRDSFLADSLAFPILEALSKTIEIDDTIEKHIELIRIRIGLITKKHAPIVHGPHIDKDLEHKSALIYLNNSDGDTLFYNEYYNPNYNMTSDEYYKNVLNKKVTIKTRITPKENSLVWFDGFQYHSSSSPTIVPRRVVININYSVK